jgi:hypothetical protein
VTTDQIQIETPVGPGRATVHRAGRKKLGTLVLGHGAGGGIDARDLVALAAALPSRGVSVVLVEQPWRLAGRKVAGPPKQLDAAWIAVLAALRPAGPLVVGGRSAGARVACRTALTVGADACLALAFPLHPPGRPERSRAAELLESGVPTLVVQGERDPFGGPAEFPSGTRIVGLPWADHSFGVPAKAGLGPSETTDRIVGAVLDWWPGR